MLGREGRGTLQRTRSWVGALATAALLLVALVAPMSAAVSRTHLSAAAVSPRVGTTATTILITVVYQNDHGSRAEQVTASVGGSDLTMSSLPAGDWGHGVTFSWSGTIPVGTHPVVLRARARDNSEASLDAGTLTITTKPTATPIPTPKPTAKPTPIPTPKPTSRPTAKPAATPKPTSRPDAKVVAQASARTTPTDPGPPSFDETIAPFAEPSQPPITATIVGGPTGGTGPGGESSGGADGTIGRGGGRPSGGPASGWGPLASILAIVGLQAPTFPGVSLGPTLVTTTGVVTAAMAFALFGRRRRDDDMPDAVMAAAAATGLAVLPFPLTAAARSAAALGSAPVDDDAARAPAPDEAIAGTEENESLMPRWRRPSLLLARKADPIRDATPAARLTFDHGLVGPLDGRERRVIRYRVVRLLDSPDELRGAEIGYLDQGDEVQLLEKYGAYWLVLSPDGQQGWLHKMTLGDILDADGQATDGAVATMPIAADSWTMGESDIDSDVFEAYLESRRREA